MKSKVKPKYLITMLIALVVVLILVFSFFVYESSKREEIKEEVKEEEYIAEEIIEPEEIIPEETAAIPAKEIEEEIAILNEVVVEIKNLRFYPEEITIAPGTTVIWFNNDTLAHKVVAYDRVFYGHRLNPGDKYAFKFIKEGTHRYFDSVFPKIGRGKIVVKEEPLPITGSVIGIDLGKEETNGKFALLVLLFIIMIFGLSHGMYKRYRI